MTNKTSLSIATIHSNPNEQQCLDAKVGLQRNPQRTPSIVVVLGARVAGKDAMRLLFLCGGGSTIQKPVGYWNFIGRTT